jgi:phosphopantetheine adenylyltransferase
MNVSARGITTVNFGGTFAMMNEGQTLLLTIVMLMGITLILNGCAEIFIRIL